MKFAALSDTAYTLRLELGDDIHRTIAQFCADHHIANAAVQGIGSVESPTLAHYSIKTKAFNHKQLEGIYEVVSLLGNVGLIEDKPQAHIHVTISDIHMDTQAGHLVKGACSATLELILTAYPSRHAKAHDDTIGLSVWEFDTL